MYEIQSRVKGTFAASALAALWAMPTTAQAEPLVGSLIDQLEAKRLGHVSVDRPLGGYVYIPERYRLDGQHASDDHTQAHAAQPRIVYMNRVGGTFTPGYDDSRQNRSSIAAGTVNLPAWNVSEAGWQQVMTCVQAQFADYNVIITDVDPGNVPHMESVVAGQPTQLNPQLDGAGGVSPWDPNNCSIIENSIVFTFAPLFGNDYQQICEVVAQEVSHSYGLDHEYLCSDPMTYLGGCGAKSFQDVDAQCGEFSPRQCECSQTQNSVQMLLSRLGPREDVPDIEVYITSPKDGDVVGLGFKVNASIPDQQDTDQVELFIDGESVATLDSAPYQFTSPADLDLGAHDIEVVARGAGGDASVSITVELSSDVDPGEGGGNPGGGDGGDGDDGPSGAGNDDIAGGCQTSSDASGTGLALLLAALWVTTRRRRRC